MEGSNGGTTFTDSSITPKTVTANGNVKISTDKCVFGRSSAYFDGNGDYLSVANDASINLSSGNFTLECWVYTSSTTGGTILNKDGQMNVSYPSYCIAISNGNFIFLAGTGNGVGGVQIITATVPFPLNVWTHVAAVKNGTTITLYQNGVNVASATQTVTIIDGGKALFIGYERDQPSTSYLNGYLDELRITKGVARYTSNFIPPTAFGPFPNQYVDPYAANVSLLAHMNGTNGSTTFIDNSITSKVITANGGAQISTVQSKFSGGSAYFDGTGDYLSIASTTDFGFGTADFTWEAWIYPVVLIGQSGRGITDFRTTGNDPGTFFIDGDLGYRLAFWYGSKLGGTGTVLSINNWYHVALTRSSGVFRCFLNGSLDWQASATVDFGSSRPLGIGGSVASLLVGTSPFNGYIDDLRITKGVARYTGNFTMPAYEFPNPGDVYYNRNSLLLHMNGTNGSTTFTDNSPSPKTVTPNGGVQISTTQSKFGGGSLLIDATTKYLSVPNSTDVDMGSGDFTIEFWIYFTTWGSSAIFVSKRTNNSVDSPIIIYGNSTNTIFRFVNTGTTLYAVTGAGIPTSTWCHIAAVRLGNNIYLYLNGVQTGSTTAITGAALSNSSALTIGNEVYQAGTAPTSSTFYIDELRITKGVARYTGNFTVPTAQFPDVQQPLETDPNYNDVSLLLHLDSTRSSPYSDYSAFNNSPTLTGTPTISTTTYKFGGGSVLIGGNNTIDYPSNSSFAIGTADFTMECWVNYNSLSSPAYQTIANINTFSSGMMFRLNPSSIVDVYVNNTQYTFNISPALSTGTWYHIAISRNSGTLRAFINGVQQGTDRTVTGSIAAGVLKLGASAHTGGEFTNGYIDDFRFTNGVGRYTANFTPPTQAFANDISGDPNYNSVSLLSHFEQIGGTLVDSSPTPKTAVANNSGYTSTISVFGPSGMQFTGTDSYANVNYSSDWNIGSFTNYTIEFWIYYSTLDDGASLMGQMAGSSNPFWRLYQTASGGKLTGIYFDHTDGAGTTSTFGWGTITEYVAPSTWTHVALVKNSNTWSLYINGNKQGTDQTFTWTVAPTWNLTVGGVNNSTYTASAFSMDDVRITKNVARYTANFLPTVAPFADYLTSFGNATVEPLPISNIANLATVDPTVLATAEPFYSSSVANLPAVSPVANNTVEPLQFSTVRSLLGPYGAGTKYISGTVVSGASAPLSRTVVAYDRSTNIPVGATVSDSLTGVFVMSVPDVEVYVVSLPLSTDGVNAQIYDRITPVNNPGPYDGDPAYANVSLLLHMDGSNGSTTFTDNSSTPKSVTPSGAAQISTSTVKYGSGSAFFDGSGDYLTIPPSSSLDISTGDFTIESWVRLNSMPTTDNLSVWQNWMMIYGHGSVSSSNGWQFQIGQTLLMFSDSYGTTVCSGTHGMTVNTWYHLAVTRSGTTFRVFVNGIQVGTSTSSITLNSGSTYWIGTETGEGAYLNGYIDDLRITKGVARYLANFTPPSGPFPNSA